MSKILTVFGASGNQGGSVIRTVLADPTLSKEFRIRAITRDASKGPIKEFASKGVEIVKVGQAGCHQRSGDSIAEHVLSNRRTCPQLKPLPRPWRARIPFS